MKCIEDTIPVLHSLGLSWVTKDAVDGDKDWYPSGRGVLNRYINLEDEGVALGATQSKSFGGGITTEWWVEDKNSVLHKCRGPEDAIILAMYLSRFRPQVEVRHEPK